MKKLLFISIIALLLPSCNSNAQADKKAVLYFKENYSNFNLEYYVFFEPELIECISDTSYRRKFETVINRQIEKAHSSNLEIAKERKIFLKIFYDRINRVNTTGKKLVESKNYLLTKLSAFKNSDFVVTEKFWEDRLNAKKRGMPFGDEECDIDYSLYTFFLYDPKLYAEFTKNNKVVNPSGKILFPTKCFLEELSELPVDYKKRVQSQLVNLISNYKGQNVDLLRKKILNADLNASYD